MNEEELITLDNVAEMLLYVLKGESIGNDSRK